MEISKKTEWHLLVKGVEDEVHGAVDVVVEQGRPYNLPIIVDPDKFCSLKFR